MSEPGVENAGYGAHALDVLHRMLHLDEEHTLRHEDGFTWWPGEVPVRFRWRAPVPGDGLPVWRLSAEVDVIRGIDPTAKGTEAFLQMTGMVLNQFSSVIEDGTLKYRALVYALPEGSTHGLAQLAYRAAFMIRSVEVGAPGAVKVLGGGKLFGLRGPKLAVGRHPRAGRRSEPATQLDALVGLALDQGGTPSPVDRRPDLGAAMWSLRQAGCDKVAGPNEADGLANVQNFNVVIETKHATALLELTLDVANPNVGRGLLAVLRVRFPSGHLHGSAAQLARELNDAEWRTAAPLHVQGVWSANATGADVAHSAFYPNFLHQPALGREVALDGLRRVRWAFDHFGYTEPFTRQGPYTNLLLGRAEAAGMEA